MPGYQALEMILRNGPPPPKQESPQLKCLYCYRIFCGTEETCKGCGSPRPVFKFALPRPTQPHWK